MGGDLDLLSQLILDSSGWKAGTDQARNTTKELKSELTGAFQSIGASGVAQFLTVGGAIAGATLFLREMVEAGAESETVMFQLRGTLQSTGRDAEISGDQIAGMANSLMGLSTFDDEDILRAYTAISRFSTIDTDSMNTIVESAMNMTAVLGGDLASNAETYGRALETGVIPRSWGWSAALKENFKDLVDTGRAGDATNLMLGEMEKRFGGQAAGELTTLNGKWKALQNTWGEIVEVGGGYLVPVLSNAADAVLILSTASAKLDQALQDHGNTVLKSSSSYKEYSDEMMRAKMASEGGTEASRAAFMAKAKELYTIDILADRYQFLTETEWENARAISETEHYYIGASAAVEGMSAALRDEAYALELAAEAASDHTAQFNFILDAAGEYKDYTKDMASAEEKLATDEQTLADLRKAGWSEYSQKVKDAKQDIEDDKTAIGDLKTAHQNAIYEMIAGWMQYQLTLDGTFSEEDMVKILDYRRAMGLMTEAEYLAALEALHLANQMAGIPDSGSWTYEFWYKSYYEKYGAAGPAAGPGVDYSNPENLPGSTATPSGPSGPGYGGGGLAEGTEGWETVPSGYPNDSYPLWLTSGEKYSVVPTGEAGGEGGGVTLYNYGTILIQDGSTAKQDILRQLRG